MPVNIRKEGDYFPITCSACIKQATALSLKKPHYKDSDKEIEFNVEQLKLAIQTKNFKELFFQSTQIDKTRVGIKYYCLPCDSMYCSDHWTTAVGQATGSAFTLKGTYANCPKNHQKLIRIAV